MNARSRTTAALLALALVAALPASCPCPSLPRADGAGHECCVPSPALRALDQECCGGASTLTEAQAVPPAPEAPASIPSAMAATAPWRFVSGLAARPTTTAPSPPPLILRI